MDTLIVCTGNICRSPMAEGLLRRRYGELGLDSVVGSAGLLRDGQPASEYGIDAMARRGIDISTHRSQRITADLVGAADLVLGMERQHVREAVVLVPEAMACSFTLPELARVAATLGPRPPGEAPESWVRRAASGRTAKDLLHNNPDDEVADPIGMSPEHYERTAREIEGLIDAVLTNLYPVPVPVTHPSPDRIGQ